MHPFQMWREIRRVRFQAHRLRLVKRAEWKQGEAETEGYLGNVGLRPIAELRPRRLRRHGEAVDRTVFESITTVDLALMAEN